MKKSDLLKYFCIVLLVFFFGLILASTNGYYEGQLARKTTLTSEAINRFEQDVKDGKNIDINNYLEDTNHNYNNRFSNTGKLISNKISTLITKGTKKLFKLINKTIESN